MSSKSKEKNSKVLTLNVKDSEKETSRKSADKNKNSATKTEFAKIKANWVGLVVLVLALMTVIATYLFLETDELSTKVGSLQQQLTSAEQKSKGVDDTKIILAKVSKHILIKDTSKPLLAEIADVDQVKKQNPVFYKDAQNGDKLLIVDGKAILYRPSTDMIINVAPVSKNNQPTDKTKEKKISLKSVKIAVLNGTNNVNAIDEFLKKLDKDFTEVNVKSRGVAPTDYTVSVVYDRSNKGAGKVIAEKLGIAYSNKVPNSIKSDADVVIVLGSDQF